MAEFRQAVSIVTKNRLVTRDIDLLGELARHRAAGVFLSITTLDPDLARVLEPRTSRPEGRLAAIRALTEAGIPTGVLIAPVIPGLTEHEIPSILQAAAGSAQARPATSCSACPGPVAALFEDWLDRHRPEAKEKVLGRIRAMRRGRLNDPRFGHRMRGEGPAADLIRQLFHVSSRQLGLNQDPWPVSTAAFTRPGRGGRERQLELFGHEAGDRPRASGSSAPCLLKFGEF